MERRWTFSTIANVRNVRYHIQSMHISTMLAIKIDHYFNIFCVISISCPLDILNANVGYFAMFNTRVAGSWRAGHPPIDTPMDNYSMELYCLIERSIEQIHCTAHLLWNWELVDVGIQRFHCELYRHLITRLLTSLRSQARPAEIT